MVDKDNFYMQEAIRLAKLGQGKVSPNPLVGSLIVKNKKIISRGFHKKSGLNHAEIEAIKKLKKNLKTGSTLYVNLEPCCNWGKTPPCVNEIIKSKIKRVVIANIDQVMVWPGDWALDWFRKRGATGGIPTIEKHTDRHSCVRIDPERPHHVLETREKERISNRATIGVYWFREAKMLLSAADAMIAANDRAPNGEFYVAPVYNYLDGIILEYPLCEFWSLGEPENLTKYEEEFIGLL